MIPERRILVYVVAMITGIILVMRYDAASQLLVSARSHQTLAQNTPFQYAAYFEGLTAATIALAAIVQLAQMPKVWQGDGTSLSILGTVE